MRRAWSMTVATPSSVDASAATGTTDRPCVRQRSDVLVEVLLRAADRDDRGARLRRPARHRRADAAAAGTGHHDDAAVETQQIAVPGVTARSPTGNCPDKIWYSASLENTIPQPLSARQGRIRPISHLLSGLVGLDNVRGHDTLTHGIAHAIPVPRGRSDGSAEGWRLERLTAAESAVRRQRSAHRTRRAGLHRAGDRQPDQRTRHRHRRLETSAPRAATSSRPTTSRSTRAATCTRPRSWTAGSACCDTAGRTRVLRDDIPSANGITFHQGRLFIGECREGGRLLELDLGGGAPRVLLENVPSPNAMEVGRTACCTSR